jgi:hypothetical protein
MMDPFTAIGFASNIAQFVGYAANLVRTAVEIEQSAEGRAGQVTTLDTLYTQLSKFNGHLVTSLDSNRHVDASHEVWESLRSLAKLSKEDCDKLLRTVGQLKTTSKGKWQSFRAALRTLWKKDEIEELEKRLQRTQTALMLHICTAAR